MTELDIFMLQAQNNQGTGMYQVALAFPSTHVKTALGGSVLKLSLPALAHIEANCSPVI